MDYGVLSPLGVEKKAITRKEVEIPSGIIYEGTIKEVNSYFYKNGLSDGLPVIPPTEEAVKEMLHGTDFPANHVVANLPLKFGNTTVEMIAINAVMAGALPTYLPVLIAATQALAQHPEWPRVATTKMSVAPCWVVNGPIRDDININSGLSLFSSGLLANSVIPRAMQLIIKNIGGVQPGTSYYGHQAMSSFCFGENETDSPWEPLHVEQGLKKEDSAISLYFVTGSCAIRHPKSSYVDDKGAMQVLTDAVTGNLGGTKGIAGFNCLFTVTSGTARLLAKYGLTKQKINTIILEQTKNVAVHEMIEGYERTKQGIKIVVAGGTNTYNGACQLNGGFGAWLTKKVELPVKWNDLVKKYNRKTVYDQQLK